MAWRGCRMMPSTTNIVWTDAYFCIVLQVPTINQLIHSKSANLLFPFPMFLFFSLLPLPLFIYSSPNVYYVYICSPMVTNHHVYKWLPSPYLYFKNKKAIFWIIYIIIPSFWTHTQHFATQFQYRERKLAPVWKNPYHPRLGTDWRTNPALW